MKNHQEKDNSFAFDSTHRRIHISDAPSGKRGYTCIGCGGQMVAVKSKRPNRISYFRHHALDILQRSTCTYSDIRERFKVASERLVELKKIKVPAVLKYPPDGEDGLPMRIVGPKIIEAFQITTACYFYEDPHNNILYGGERTNPELTLLLKADVVFFDQREVPILIVQFVDRHRITNDIKSRMHNLGINAVQVSIPRESPDAIARVFLRTDNTKWLYNNEHTTTQYVRVPFSDAEGIPDVDELQREFFEENFFCRRAQTTRLIRQISKFLESKHYKDTEEGLRSEISRVEHESRNICAQLSELYAKAETEIHGEFKSNEDAIRVRRDRIRFKSDQASRVAIGLKKRYEGKRDQIAAEERSFESRVDEESRRKGTTGSSIITRKREIETKIRGTERDIESGKTRIAEIQRNEDSLPEEFRRKEEVERNGVNVAERIKRRDTSGDPELSRRLKEITEVRRHISDYIKNFPTYARYQKAWRSFRSGAYKNWHDEGAVHSENAPPF